MKSSLTPAPAIGSNLTIDLPLTKAFELICIPVQLKLPASLTQPPTATIPQAQSDRNIINQ